MAFLGAWILTFLFPPLAVFALPDYCVPDKGTAFLVAFLLTILFLPIAWVYDISLIEKCESMTPPQTVKVVPATASSGKVSVIVVGGG